MLDVEEPRGTGLGERGGHGKSEVRSRSSGLEVLWESEGEAVAVNDDVDSKYFGPEENRERDRWSVRERCDETEDREHVVEATGVRLWGCSRLKGAVEGSRENGIDLQTVLVTNLRREADKNAVLDGLLPGVGIDDVAFHMMVVRSFRSEPPFLALPWKRSRTRSRRGSQAYGAEAGTKSAPGDEGARGDERGGQLG